MEKKESKEFLKEAGGFHFVIDGHLQRKSLLRRGSDEGPPHVVRVGSRGKTLGLLKVRIVNGSLDFEDRSGMERNRRSLERFQKQLEKMIEQAEGQDPMKAYEESDRRYKRAKRIKERIERLEGKLSITEGKSFFELERINMGKGTPSDPEIENKINKLKISGGC